MVPYIESDMLLRSSGVIRPYELRFIMGNGDVNAFSWLMGAVVPYCVDGDSGIIEIGKSIIVINLN